MVSYRNEGLYRECMRRIPGFTLERVTMKGERCVRSTCTRGGKLLELAHVIPPGPDGEERAATMVLEASLASADKWARNAKGA